MPDERQPNEYPVEALGPFLLPIGDGLLPVALSQDWDRVARPVQGALVVLHGRLRNAGDYLRAGVAAVDGRPGWLVAAPQFPAQVDIDAHAAADATLRWDLTEWMGGGPALAPAPLSAFAALDAVLARLRRVPGLDSPAARIVVAGHSGGGQVVQRYAMLGASGAGIRFVVANPSSYAFPDAWRPEPTCAGFDDWKYGLDRLPGIAAHQSRAALLDRYAARDVTYLLGAADNDPAHPALDTTGPARCQGPHRLARGLAFHQALRRCRPACRHALHIVPGVGHDGHGMLTSAEGAHALFG